MIVVFHAFPNTFIFPTSCCFNPDGTPLGSLKTLYRYYNAAKQEHYYTSDPSEMGTTTYGVMGSNGNMAQGVAF